MARAVPVVFMAYDVLENEGTDIRHRTLAERRAQLDALIPGAGGVLRVSPSLEAGDWETLAAMRANSRALAVEATDGLVWFWIGTHADYDRLLS